jgi:hypothetical protein
MTDTARGVPSPAFVVLRQAPDGRWDVVAEVTRQRGLTARAARCAAIMEATTGTAKAGEVYAAILRSEWRVAFDWTP